MNLSSPRISIIRCAERLFSLSTRGMQTEVTEGPVHSVIKSKLREELKPTHMQIFNESYMHNVPSGSESHFKVVVVSEKFDGVPLIKRHRMVMDTLKEELDSGVHALSIQAKTPGQWEKTQKITQSPPCLGGANR